MYLCEEDIEDANVMMEFDYVQRKYNICNNSEEFELHMDEETVKKG